MLTLLKWHDQPNDRNGATIVGDSAAFGNRRLAVERRLSGQPLTSHAGVGETGRSA